MDDEFKPLPTRSGPAQGDRTERVMIDRAGGQNTIATRIQTNPDGSTTLLKTRGGFPHFHTIEPEAKSTEAICQKGLYYDGTITYTYDEMVVEEDRYVVTGGYVKPEPEDAEPGKTLKKQPPPILGSVFSAGSGLKRRACKKGVVTEIGAKSWYATLEDGSTKVTITLNRNQPLARADNVPLHQYSLLLEKNGLTNTVSGYVTGLVRSNLTNVVDYGAFDGEPYNQHHAVLVDVSSDGTKMLIEIHERLIRTGDVNLSSLALKNRERLSMPQTFVSAYELVLSGPFSTATATPTIQVHPKPYYRTGLPGHSQPPNPPYYESELPDPPPLPSPWKMLYNQSFGGQGLTLHGVCYSAADIVTPFFSLRISRPPGPTLDVDDILRIGTQTIEFNHYTSETFYTNPAYDPEDEFTWNYRYGNPIRLSNRCFGLVVANQWLSNYVTVSPYNQFVVEKVASPDMVATVNLELPVSFSERLPYDFYYRGLEGEIYPNIYGTVRLTDGKPAAALHKTLCWI